jgi:hypothetical protein
MRCWVCSLSHRMESSCHRNLGEPDLSCSGLECDKKMHHTSRVNAHLHHSPSRAAAPRPSRDSCPLAQAQEPWPGHDRARARKEGTEEISSGANVTVDYRSRRYPSVPDRKDLGAAASPRTGATLDGTALHSGRHISVDIPVDIVVDNFVD